MKGKIIFCMNTSLPEGHDTSLSCMVLGTNGLGQDKIIDQLGDLEFEQTNAVPSYISVTQGERAGLIFTNDRKPYFTLGDLELGGRFPIRIIRTYNGETSASSGFGYGWQPNFARKLLSGSSIRLTTSSGQTTMPANLSNSLVFINDYSETSASFLKGYVVLVLSEHCAVLVIVIVFFGRPNCLLLNLALANTTHLQLAFCPILIGQRLLKDRARAPHHKKHSDAEHE